MVSESWFHSIWKPSKNHNHGPEKARIGVLVFEVASVMSKLVHQWNSLTDKQVMKLREEISNSVGIKKLISEDDDHVVDLICTEMLHNLENIAKVVTRLSKKCKDPLLICFERAYDDLIKHGVDQYQWQVSWKKMNTKVKKMETFIMVNANLYQEMETLTELEQMLKRMKNNEDHDTIIVAEYTKKVTLKQKQVRRLKEISLWNRTYDYVVLLLARSIFTIFARIGHVFGITHVLPQIEESMVIDSSRNQSVSGFLESSVTMFNSGPLGNINAKSGPISKFYSGPLGKQRNTSYFSGTIANPTSSKSGPLTRAAKSGLKWWNNSSKIHGKSITPNLSSTNSKTHNQVSRFSSKKQKPQIAPPPPETLGAVALALHYANVIIVLEKLVASPHLIGHDARDDLYNMLPKTVRNGLRGRLKPYAKSMGSCVYDNDLAEEWSEAMLGILDWLSPLAHNMIRWQSERSFEHQNLLSRTNVLLVQTVYYANQEKIEAMIVELLVGLNYIWRFSREVNAKSLECENGVDD
ncbi:uncharacterized protein LOC111903013 [Lactuca sativa]|uniref:uncharacterized protein LOC111903013 n=1 Tax=Lactuca sativa TaxID=4236 RepID=UPI000CC885D7|nr:uncharacterized protein LOC111903013 [Lactuca sativa]